MSSRLSRGIASWLALTVSMMPSSWPALACSSAYASAEGHTNLQFCLGMPYGGCGRHSRPHNLRQQATQPYSGLRGEIPGT